MDIESLKIITLVAEQGSFAAAARSLDVDPSKVSRTVGNAEAELGLRIFQRSTRRLSLTEEGEIYVSRIGPLLQGLEQAHDSARALRAGPTGTLRLTASVAFAHECIVPYLPQFHRLYPDVTVELLPTDATLDLAANAIDLAIRLAPTAEGDLITSRLMSTRYRVCASPGYVADCGAPNMPSELANRPCLRFALPQYRTRWRFRQDEGDVVEVPVSGPILIANALSLRQAARDGLGPALLADWLVRDDIKNGTLIDLFPNHACTATEFETAAWMLYPSRAYLPEKVRVMIDFLRTQLGSRST